LKAVDVLHDDDCVIDDHANAEHFRFALANAFLSNGFKVKDAGQFKEVTFNANLYPSATRTTETTTETTSGDDGAEVVTRTTTNPDYWRGYWSWYRNRGIKLEITDPTSLWAPEVAEYQGLESAYFFRIFRLEFSNNRAMKVTRRTAYSEETVAEFTSGCEASNTAIDRYNEKLRRQQKAIATYEERYDTAAQRYMGEYDQYARTHAQEQDDLAHNYERLYNDYSNGFSRWQSLHPRNLRVSASPKANLSAFRVDAEPPVTLSPKAPNELPALASPLDAELLLANSSEAREELVLLTNFELHAQVIDAKTGEVVWVGKVGGYAQRAYDARETILRETVRLLVSDSR
jgi:hypothetical protein